MWRHGLGLVRDVVRQELVARQLTDRLPSEPGRALDLGCGQGTQAIRLARAGWSVVGLDISEELLSVAAAARAAEPVDVAARIELRPGNLLDLGADVLGSADLVCCHGVLMYLPSLAEAVAAVVSGARPGGLVSLLTRNQAGIALRAGMTGDWDGVAAGLESRTYRNRLGLDAVRADRPGEVAEALSAAGAERTAWYGVRLLTDHWETTDVPADVAALLAAEAALGARDPYRAVAALTHTIAVRTR